MLTKNARNAWRTCLWRTCLEWMKVLSQYTPRLSRCCCDKLSVCFLPEWISKAFKINWCMFTHACLIWGRWRFVLIDGDYDGSDNELFVVVVVVAMKTMLTLNSLLSCKRRHVTYRIKVPHFSLQFVATKWHAHVKHCKTRGCGSFIQNDSTIGHTWRHHQHRAILCSNNILTKKEILFQHF